MLIRELSVKRYRLFRLGLPGKKKKKKVKPKLKPAFFLMARRGNPTSFKKKIV